MIIKIKIIFKIVCIIFLFSSCGGSISETSILNNSSTETLIVELFNSNVENFGLWNDTICIIDGPRIKCGKFVLNNISAVQYQSLDTLEMTNNGLRGKKCRNIQDDYSLDYVYKENLVEILQLDLNSKKVHLKLHVLPNNKLVIGYIGNLFSEIKPSLDWDSVKIIKENKIITINKKNVVSMITREGRKGSCGLNENFFIIDENKNEQ